MTIVKCDLKNCLNNDNGICKAEDIELNNDGGTFECLDYETQEFLDAIEKIKREWQ